MKTNFVEYSGLKRAVLEMLKNTDINEINKLKMIGPKIPNSISVFYKHKTGCKDMYNIFINEKKGLATCISKWKENNILFTDAVWNKIFELPFKITQESKLQWLQFQILHRIIPTNYYLFRLKLIDSPSCTFCKNDIETIDHLFVECFQVKELWCRIEEWILEKFNIHCSFDRQGILFGKYENKNIYKLQNLLILVVKQFIFASKYKNVPKLHGDILIKVIIDRIFIEKFLLLQSCRFIEYERHWQNICNVLI